MDLSHRGGSWGQVPNHCRNRRLSTGLKTSGWIEPKKCQVRKKNGGSKGDASSNVTRLRGSMAQLVQPDPQSRPNQRDLPKGMNQGPTDAFDQRCHWRFLSVSVNSARIALRSSADTGFTESARKTNSLADPLKALSINRFKSRSWVSVAATAVS